MIIPILKLAITVVTASILLGGLIALDKLEDSHIELKILRNTAQEYAQYYHDRPHSGAWLGGVPDRCVGDLEVYESDYSEEWHTYRAECPKCGQIYEVQKP